MVTKVDHLLCLKTVILWHSSSRRKEGDDIVIRNDDFTSAQRAVVKSSHFSHQFVALSGTEGPSLLWFCSGWYRWEQALAALVDHQDLSKKLSSYPHASLPVSFDSAELLLLSPPWAVVTSNDAGQHLALRSQVEFTELLWQNFTFTFLPAAWW